MNKIELHDLASLRAIANHLRRGARFVLVSDDAGFDPLGYDRHSAQVWAACAGGGALMAAGVWMVTAAFLDPEPTSKLGLLVGGGIATTLAGGSVLFIVALARVGYRCTGRVERAGGKVEWTLEPTS